MYHQVMAPMGICPQCRAYEVVHHSGKYVCEGSLYGECSFAIWPNGNGGNRMLAAILAKHNKSVTPDMMRRILDGFTAPLTDLISKNGKPYELVVTLAPQPDGSYEFEHGFPRRY